MNFCLRRLFSTEVPKLPTAFVARTASAPIAVRLRRDRRRGRQLQPGETDATTDGLTPTEQTSFARSKLKGLVPKIVDPDGSERDMNSAEWAEYINTRRSRIRGLQTITRDDGQTDTYVQGIPIYLPNIVFKLIRNHTPAGEAYNPYEATFRLPLSITKTDIRSYLDAVYGVKTTYIRTHVYQPVPLSKIQLLVRKQGKPIPKKRGYKRVVVGLVDPFYYPHREEDMTASQAAEYDTYLNDNFGKKESAVVRRLDTLVQANKLSKLKQAAYTNLIANQVAVAADIEKRLPVSGRVKILQRVAEQRRKREQFIDAKADEWVRKREEGQEIVLRRPPPPGKDEPSSGGSLSGRVSGLVDKIR